MCANRCGLFRLALIALSLAGCEEHARSIPLQPQAGSRAQQIAVGSQVGNPAPPLTRAPPLVSGPGWSMPSPNADAGLPLMAATQARSPAAQKPSSMPSGDDRRQCAQGRDGNWVCAWPVGAWGSAGPCAFGPDGTLYVASQFASNTSAIAALTRFREDGGVAWSREFSGSQAQPNGGPRISALVVDRKGIVYWGGEDCDPAMERPAATPALGYYNSCLDARLVALDESGTILWDWSFGTATGLERISSIALAPQGLYLAGMYHPPLVLPNRAPIGSAGGEDLYAMQFVDPEHVAWVHTWGSSDHDGNDLRIASDANGEVVVTGHLGLDPTPPGFYARLSADGTVLWETQADDTYIADIAVAGDGLAYSTPGLHRIGKSGERTQLPARLAAGIARIRATDHDTLIVASPNLDSVAEIDLDGELSHEHRMDVGTVRWYQGGVCTRGDSVAVSGQVERSTNFGILETPLPIAERSAYVLFLGQL